MNKDKKVKNISKQSSCAEEESYYKGKEVFQSLMSSSYANQNPPSINIKPQGKGFFNGLVMDNQELFSIDNIKPNSGMLSSLYDTFSKRLYSLINPNIIILSIDLSYDNKYIKYALSVQYQQEYRFELICLVNAKVDIDYVLYRPLSIPFHVNLDAKLMDEFEFVINDISILLMKFSRC